MAMQQQQTKEFTFVDLGLPSGRKWATENALDNVNYFKAKDVTGGTIPTIRDWYELMLFCHWKWDLGRRGIVLTGPNRKKLFLPAAGSRLGLKENYEYKTVIHEGFVGSYWSSTPREPKPLEYKKRKPLIFENFHFIRLGRYDKKGSVGYHHAWDVDLLSVRLVS